MRRCMAHMYSEVALATSRCSVHCSRRDAEPSIEHCCAWLLPALFGGVPLPSWAECLPRLLACGPPRRGWTSQAVTLRLWRSSGPPSLWNGVRAPRPSYLHPAPARPTSSSGRTTAGRARSLGPTSRALHQVRIVLHVCSHGTCQYLLVRHPRPLCIARESVA